MVKKVTLKKTLNHFLKNLYLADLTIEHKLTPERPQNDESKPSIITNQELNIIIKGIK